MFEGPNNEIRASWAEDAVNVFAEEVYCGRTFTDTVVEQPEKGGDAYTMIGDLMGNLMHLAARHGWDPVAMMENAKHVYADEVAEEAELATAED